MNKSFPAFRGKLLSSLPNVHFKCTEGLFRGLFCSANINQINFFPDSRRKTFLFCGNNTRARTSKLDSPCREQSFSQSCLSWNFHNFLPVFGLWVKKFLIFVEFSKWVVKTILKCTVENLMKTFLERVRVSCFWRSFSNKFPNYWQSFLDRAFKTEVYVSRGFFQGKIFREYFFWTSSSEFGNSRRNNNRLFVKTIFNSFRGLFGERFLN